MAGENDVPVRILLLTVFQSIAEVFLLCLAGYILAYAGITDKATQRKLNVINVSLFTPALLFSKVAFSLTPAKLKEMWIIPLGFVIVSGLSALVAWVMAKIFRLKKSQTAFAICASMFQNSNSLPIALIQSLVVEVPGLKWGKDDSKDQMLGRALTYLVLYSTLGMMLRWSWGVKLLSHADDEAPDVGADACVPGPSILGHGSQEGHVHIRSPEAIEPTHPGARETDPFFTNRGNITQDEAEDARNVSRSFGSAVRSASPDSTWQPELSARSVHPLHSHLVRRGSSARSSIGRGSGVRSPSVSSQRRTLSRADSGREFLGLPEPPRRKLTFEDVQEDSSEEEDEGEWGGSNGDQPLLHRGRAPEPPHTRLQAFLANAWEKAQPTLQAINQFMTVPMWAALISIFIAMIPPLQAFLGKLEPFEKAIKGAGQCSIPVTLVVLGAFFYTPPDPAQAISLPTNDQSSPKSNNSLGGFFERKLKQLRQPGPPAYPGENKAVFVAVISRMVIVPAILLPTIALLARFDPFEVTKDPVFILAAVLLISSPPALTLAQITQAASGDAFERLISKTISWSYAVLTPPLTLVYVVIGLVFGRL
ncbi:auxin efflux carrier [Papiliotrema laurentii]|uniref:Auxin efflux carrier n=1 Tax=Papiliotrema laurentii TaxID=5418 RepID=A0AAD9FUV6_PAPLA|nr:auxin efflux carrier [Papiliotrema laurentii]